MELILVIVVLVLLFGGGGAGVAVEVIGRKIVNVRVERTPNQMSVSGQTQKSECATGKSALPLTTGIVRQTCPVQKPSQHRIYRSMYSDAPDSSLNRKHCVSISFMKMNGNR